MPRTPKLQPRKKPRQDRSAVTVDAILTATVQVLRKNGYAKATLGRIAKRAGVSVGSIYQYYPSKEALLAAVMTQHLDAMHARMQAEVAAHLTAPLPQLVRAVVQATVDAHLDDPQLHRVFVEEFPRVGRFAHYDAVQQQLIDGVVVLLQARSDVRDANAQHMARIVVTAMEAVVHDYVFRGVGDARDVVIDELTHLLLSYLR